MAIIFSLILAFIAGCFATFYLLNREKRQPPAETATLNTQRSKEAEEVTEAKTAEVEVPKELFPSLVTSGGGGASDDALTAVNLLVQFLFRELRFSKSLHQAIIQRINEEIEDQLSGSRAGKLIERIIIHDYDLGNTVPLMKKMEVSKSEIEPIKKTVESMEIVMEIEYSGHFNLSLDVHSTLVPNTRISLIASGLKGEGKLGFSRRPFTHWAFSFIKPPIVDMEVKSTIQGTTYSKVTTLVAALASKILQRAHVLPNYRIRYKPFFNPPDISLHEYPRVARPVQVGSLSVTIKECSRLLEPILRDTLHCTIGVGMNAFVSVGHSETPNLYVMTLKVVRKRNQPFGIIFKPSDSENTENEGGPAVIAAVTPGSPAHATGLQQYDLITFVDGVPTTTVKEAASAIIGAGERFMMTIERKGVLNVIASDLDRYVDIDMPIVQLGVESEEGGFSPVAEPVDELPSFLSPTTIEKPASAYGVMELDKTTNIPIQTEDTTETASKNLEVAAEATPFKRLTQEITIKQTTTLAASPDININETINLEIRPGDHYLNFGLWTTSKNNVLEKDLVGHLCVPLMEIVSECEATSLSNYVTTYQICPPDCQGKDAQNLEISSHTGFDPRLCYGDVLFSFVYKPAEEQPVKGVGVKTSEGKDVAVDEIAHSLIKGSEMILEETGTKSKDHTFVVTHFYGVPVFCDYCNGRIWLRDAVQCITCGTICHKKCKDRCRQTVCQPMRKREKGHLLKKTDVHEDLKIPFSIEDVEELIEDNPFLPTEDEEGDELNAAVHRILRADHDEKVTQLAKETAHELYDHLTFQERKEKILSMISKLQKAIESEGNQSVMLAGQSQIEGVTSDVRKRLAMQISRSDEKKKALALLLLHYSYALEYVADLENAMKVEAEKTMEEAFSSNAAA
ncbi:PDZ domain-containing protein 8-like [Artemia franciscana]|uniref:PDZ domain-containing protein 8 n=1 Tax=Artemia franciscana TaxID=6661 RepID=A0AA88I088_ARTSF|nr:hypothetical protein QYM36_006372 [Artemia franciscana]